MKRIFLLSLLSLALTSQAVLANPAQTAEKVIGDFQSKLMTELKTGLQQGPSHAIDVCRNRAPQIAQELSTDTLKIGRATSQLRNQSNRGPQWASQFLAYYAAHPDEKKIQSIQLTEKTWGYVKPIYIQRPCLTCHGESVSPSIRQALVKNYPLDQAINYKVGDFRGLFWVEIHE
nr:DUF3365 domain-containing protein [uncultured Desulfuromonas sp.]